jgi:hypothetical protein
MTAPTRDAAVTTTLRRRPTPRPTRAAWLVVAAWAVVVLAASVIHAPWPLHRAALFIHLAALLAGFGAVLAVDLHGVLWLIGRRRLGDLLQITSALQPLIWGGLVGLVASGLLLRPNLLLPRTMIKLVLVLVATLNGMWAHHLSGRLKDHPVDATAGAVDQRLLLKIMGAGAISQAAWWGATLIGFLATTSR